MTFTKLRYKIITYIALATLAILLAPPVLHVWYLMFNLLRNIMLAPFN